MPCQNEIDTLKAVLKKILGVILIILGIAGLFLPFLQGIAMIITGIIFLGNHKLLAYLQNLKIKIVTLFKKVFKRD